MTPSAARALSTRLPHAVAAAVLELMQGDLLREPHRVGPELQRELAGTWSARRGTYRILYEIIAPSTSGPTPPGDASTPPVGIVRVLDVDHRGDVYRRR